MRLSLPLIVAMTLTASGVASALTDEEAATIRCAATGVVLSATLLDFVEAGADLSDDYLALVDQAALDLLLDAEPLFAAEEANAEMGRVADELVAEGDAAIEEGTAAEWLQETTDDVRDCHMASPRYGQPEQ